MIDVNTDAYTRYRGECMVEGAKRILASGGIIVSFNGSGYDLPRLVKLCGLSASDMPALRGIHHTCKSRLPATAGPRYPEPLRSSAPAYGITIGTTAGNRLPSRRAGSRTSTSGATGWIATWRLSFGERSF